TIFVSESIDVATRRNVFCPNGLGKASINVPVFFCYRVFVYIHALYRKIERHRIFRYNRMALLEKQLFVKKSTIPNAGKGLFTKKAIAKGTRIVEYKGKISAWKDVKDEDGKNGY